MKMKKKVVSKTKKKDYIQPEMRNILKAIGKYVDVNKGCVYFVGSFMAYDIDKLKANRKDACVDGSDRVFACGEKDILKMMIGDLQKTIKREADGDGFVLA